MNGLGLYQVATAALEPLAPLVLKARARKGKEDLSRLNERLGKAALPRPGGPLIWLHGVSVGESLSLLPLVERLRLQRPDLALLVTSGTVTSAALLARRLPAGVIHQYAPVDGRRAVRRFLDHWRPDVGLFAESELWPNLILDAHGRGVKLALVSARITAHSADGWARRPQAAKALLSAFDLILPQDAVSAERLTRLGAHPGPLLNLKLAGGVLPCDEQALAQARAAIAGRPVLLGASTHSGEEIDIARARPPGALAILALRHPDRGEQVARDLAQAGLKVALRGAGQAPTPDLDVYIADTLGEMGLWFRLADLVVMGGSFVTAVGGHNPLEPARLGAGVVSGPHAFNFAGLYDEMAQAGAARLVDRSELAPILAELMADSKARRLMAQRAQAFADAQGAALDQGLALIDNLLPPAGRS